MVGEVDCPVERGFLGDELVVTVRADGCAEGDQAVLVGPLGLVDEPVVVVRLGWVLMMEQDGLGHGVWYGWKISPTMVLIARQMAWAAEDKA